MLRMTWATGMVVGLAFMARAARGRADDTFLLNGKGSAQTLTLESKGGAEPVPVGWYRGPIRAGWRGGFRRPLWRPGLYRPLAWRGYRPYWGWRGRYWGGYRPYWGWRARTWGGYRPYWGWRDRFWGPTPADWVGFGLSFLGPGRYAAPAYPVPGFYSVPDGACYPGGPILGSVTTITPSVEADVAAPPAQADVLPKPRRVPSDQTYPYDGGPADPVPMPKADDKPTVEPSGKSLPPVKYVYRAFGEDTGDTSLAGLKASPPATEYVRKTRR